MSNYPDDYSNSRNPYEQRHELSDDRAEDLQAWIKGDLRDAVERAADVIIGFATSCPTSITLSPDHAVKVEEFVEDLIWEFYGEQINAAKTELEEDGRNDTHWMGRASKQRAAKAAAEARKSMPARSAGSAMLDRVLKDWNRSRTIITNPATHGGDL
jgi:hypothetical protein